MFFCASNYQKFKNSVFLYDSLMPTKKIKAQISSNSPLRNLSISSRSTNQQEKKIENRCQNANKAHQNETFERSSMKTEQTWQETTHGRDPRGME